MSTFTPLYNDPMSLSIIIKKTLPGFVLDIAFESDSKRIGILGASGSGKSLTLKSIAGIIRPDEGRISFNDAVWFDKNKRVNIKTSKRNVGYLFQNRNHQNAENTVGKEIRRSSISVRVTKKVTNPLLLDSIMPDISPGQNVSRAYHNNPD